MNIAIVGAGYVGLSNSLLLAQNHEVVIYDINASKVEKLNNNISPIIDAEIEDIIMKINNSFLATRYHSLIIDKKTLSKDFEIIASTQKNIIMGIAHKKMDIYGLQFHPDSIGTLDGKKILKNFLKIINYES